MLEICLIVYLRYEWKRSQSHVTPPQWGVFIGSLIDDTYISYMLKRVVIPLFRILVIRPRKWPLINDANESGSLLYVSSTSSFHFFTINYQLSNLVCLHKLNCSHFPAMTAKHQCLLFPTSVCTLFFVHINFQPYTIFLPLSQFVEVCSESCLQRKQQSGAPLLHSSFGNKCLHMKVVAIELFNLKRLAENSITIEINRQNSVNYFMWKSLYFRVTLLKPNLHSDR